MDNLGETVGMKIVQVHSTQFMHTCTYTSWNPILDPAQSNHREDSNSSPYHKE